MKRRYKIGIGIIAFLAFLYFLGTFQAYRDWVFICENTASTKGHTEWFFGKETFQWYEKSVFEDFLRENYPDVNIEHRWTSIAGTGRNIFGRALLRGHGRPGAIHSIPPEMLETWVQISKPEQVRQLYELLASDNDEDIKKQRIDETIEEVFEYLGSQ